MLIAVGLVLCVSRSIFPAGIAFCAYVGYLIQVKLSGGNSCNCFGGYEQDIRFVMALDFICLGILLISNPSQTGRRWFRLPAIIVVAIPVSILFWVLNPGLSKLVAESFSPGPLRSSSLAEMQVVATTDFKTEVDVTNRSRSAIHIKRILASCDCTKLSPETLALEPGESTTLSVTINLTKSYTADQSSSQHHIDASCYDSDDNVIAQIRLFKGRSFRTFGVENRTQVFPWSAESQNELEIPISWFSNSEAPVECSIQGVVVGSAHFPDPIRMRLNRPVSFFENRKLTLSRSVDAKTTTTDVDISVVAKPGLVTCDFRPAIDSIELSAKQGFEGVDVRVYDSLGELSQDSQIAVDDDRLKTTLAVGPVKSFGSSYFDLALNDKNTLSHRIIIPFCRRGTNDE